MEYFTERKLKGKKRSKAHIIGEKGVNILRELFPENWVVREYYPDYGIDLSVELFDEEDRTKGEFLLFQVKGTEKLDIKKLKCYSRMNVEKEYKEDKTKFCTIEVIKYQLDVDLLTSVEKIGNAVIVILCVVDIQTKNTYFVCLNDYIEKILIPKNEKFQDQTTVTINIPVENCLNSEKGKTIIEWYGKRAKLYAFFNKVHYQLNELNYSTNLEYVKLTDHFLKILVRLDVWSAVDYFPALRIAKEEINYYLKHHNTKIGVKELERMLEKGEDVDSKIYEATYCVGEVSFREANLCQSLHILWDSLDNVGNIFEEIAKEAFLPTYFFNAFKD